MCSHPAHILSLGLGTGLSKIAPGTMGTLLGWLSFVLLDYTVCLSPIAWAIVITVSFAVGVAATGYTAKKMNLADPGAINWDEVVGIGWVMWWIMPASSLEQCIAFLLFRFFDAFKPQPIRYFDKRLRGGFGIMFDDLVAAFFTLLVIALWHRLH
jgi:phosphatidylglycerophosphatase A